MKSILMSIGLLASVTATPARANIYDITFTGVISQWQWTGSNYVHAPTIDYYGLFGPAGASLTGNPFTVIYEVQPYRDRFYGPNYGGGTALMTATLIINDHGVILGTTGYIGALVNSDSGAITAMMTVALITPFNDLPGNVQIDTFIDNRPKPTGIPGSFQEFSYTFNPLTDNLMYPHQLGGAFGLAGETGYLEVQTVTLRQTPAPIAGAGWPALILAGLWYAYKQRRLPCSSLTS